MKMNRMSGSSSKIFSVKRASEFCICCQPIPVLSSVLLCIKLNHSLSFYLCRNAVP